MPDWEAISKKVSGVESPKENLPREVEEKMANLVPVSSKISMSAVKEAPFLNSQNPVIVSLLALEAGPLVQSNLTKDKEAPLSVRLNILASKDKEPRWVKVELLTSLLTEIPLKGVDEPPPESSSPQENWPVDLFQFKV